MRRIDFTCYNTDTTIMRVKQLTRIQLFEKILEKILKREGNGKVVRYERD